MIKQITATATYPKTDGTDVLEKASNLDIRWGVNRAAEIYGVPYETDFNVAIVFTAGSTNKDSDTVLAGLNFITHNFQEGDRIIVYGYSFGGDAAINLCRVLKEEGRNVEYLVIVDSTDGTGNSTVDYSVSDNVKKAINVYQTTPQIPPYSKGEPIKADDPKKTSVQNINATGETHSYTIKDEKGKEKIIEEPVDHLNIDEYAADNFIFNL